MERFQKNPPSSERRAAILEAATSAFADHGFRGASLRDIAQAADVSLTLIVHHFVSKPQLFEAVLTAHGAFFEQRAAALRRHGVLDATPHALQRLIGTWVDDAVRLAQGRQSFLRLLARMRFERVASHAIQHGADASNEALRCALSPFFPDAAMEAVRAASRFAESALLDFIAGASEGPTSRDDLVCFIAGGVAAIRASASLMVATDRTERRVEASLGAGLGGPGAMRDRCPT